ncbi:BZ3500_MvSof-1268-A1-R1_Chr3-1g05572 [Microbotryum saponariae]|uniref:BZ3500_MvSof-1268-A1-R1_Chr3-1g05572 protein n=1 Tax=Microbotryum saponariae TaxID=289078 RepID=A0A2X0NB71_9BASI|nr:BZ3500_MvSof-1268-A1-R1_Chr3-1g05572 [Microbotryum saponariae]SDA04762.1 BZ3501_MvSof-1269-A2-R1_Chr3-1g05242 [Microbotryum saponariae]
MSENVLVDRTNAALNLLNEHAFKAHELKASVVLRSSTQRDATSLLDATNLTGYGDDDLGLVMDPDDKLSAVRDLKAFKDSVSALKFACLESNTKVFFVENVLDPQGPKFVSLEENDALGKQKQQRLQSKIELKQRKTRAIELEEQIRSEADVLDGRLRQTEEDAMVASKLLRECEEMEREIAFLKNKRSEADRITIDEAFAQLEAHDGEIVEIGTKIRDAEAKLPRTKSAIKTAKGKLDQLKMVNREMSKELEERQAKGTRDERAEEGCRWITNTTALYSSLMGIRSAYSVGAPPTEMILELETTEGDVRALKIEYGPDGRMRGASLVDSSDDIEDLVEARLHSQDVRSLVQDVRARILR